MQPRGVKQRTVEAMFACGSPNLFAECGSVIVGKTGSRRDDGRVIMDVLGRLTPIHLERAHEHLPTPQTRRSRRLPDERHPGDPGRGQGRRLQRIGSPAVDPIDSRNARRAYRRSPFRRVRQALLEERNFVPPAPIEYRTWGTEIDDAAHAQMRQSCQVPVAREAALMPDAHVGYGLPIGGVLACENAVIPYAVGVDIACRMKLSVLDIPTDAMQARFDVFQNALEKGTRFGVGSVHERPQEHPVMDRDWTITRITREHRDRAWNQLGTSGSGNHFVEFGILTLAEPTPDLDLAPGEYVALLSHSGSRGAGAAVCSVYSAIAQSRLPKHYEELGRLAWLDLESEAGQEYWAAMNLMGDICGRQPRGHPPAGLEVARCPDHCRRGKPSQFCLEGRAWRAGN